MVSINMRSAVGNISDFTCETIKHTPNITTFTCGTLIHDKTSYICKYTLYTFRHSWDIHTVYNSTGVGVMWYVWMLQLAVWTESSKQVCVLTWCDG